jgi:nitrogen regulatory protein PII
MKLILFVLQDAEKLLDLLTAWKAVGVSGATVLFSTGMGRLHLTAPLLDDLPLMPSLNDFYVHDEKLSRTVLTIVHDEMVEKIITVTEQTVGDLNKPGTGILVILPTDSVYGLIEYKKQADAPGSPV